MTDWNLQSKTILIFGGTGTLMSEIAKSFAEQVGKGDVQVKHGSDESKTDSPY